jgi:hypothetical protein
VSLPPEYLSTVFLLQDPPDPLPPAFAIVTAWNPEGMTAGAAVNEITDRSPASPNGS